MAPSLETITLDSWQQAIDLFYERGWSDGLPIVPPTGPAVTEMLDAGALEGSELLGVLAQRGHELRAWQAATFAVMSGCLPPYFPVVLATWEALFDPAYNLHAALSSTGGSAIAGIVSGPYGAEIGMNARSSVFGPGNRANATIGRAIRLGAIIALEATPGVLDASSFGHWGKYTMHFAEDPPPRPWIPVCEQLGFASDTTTVTVLAAEAPRQLIQRLNPEPEGLLRTIVGCMKDPAQNGTGKGTYYIIVLGPEHAGMLRDGGWTQQEIREFLGRESRITPDELARSGVLLDTGGNYDMTPARDGTLPVADPKHILLVTAGGEGAGFSAVIPSWTGRVNHHPVSRPVRLLGQPRQESAGPLRNLDWL